MSWNPDDPTWPVSVYSVCDFAYWLPKVSEKLKRIQEIWTSGFGVVILHVFLSVIPVEAYTREAVMIDAIGWSLLSFSASTQNAKSVFGIRILTLCLFALTVSVPFMFQLFSISALCYYRELTYWYLTSARRTFTLWIGTVAGAFLMIDLANDSLKRD